MDCFVNGFDFFRDENVSYDIRYFDMKVLFLLTAIDCDIRTKVRDDLHGLTYLIETLHLFMNQASEVKEFSVRTYPKNCRAKNKDLFLLG